MTKLVTSTNTGVIANSSPQLANGTVSAPSLAFTNSTTTGIYRLAADSMGFSAAGVAVGNYSATGAWALGPSTGATAQTHTIQSGSDITVELKSFGTSGITNNLRLISGSTSGNSNLQFYNGATLRSAIVADNLNTFAFGANSLVFRQASTSVGAVTSAGAWTLGVSAASSTLEHTIYGQSSALSTGNPLLHLRGNNSAVGDGDLLLGTTNGAVGTGGAWISALRQGSGPAPLRFGSNTTDIGGYSHLGAWTFGPSTGSGLTHTVQSNGQTELLVKPTDGTATTRAILSMSNGAGTTLGQFLTAANGTDFQINLNQSGSNMQFRNGAGVINGSMAYAGSWTLGASSGNQTHIIQSAGATQVQADQNGVLIKGRTDGAAIAAGYVGEVKYVGNTSDTSSAFLTVKQQFTVAKNDAGTSLSMALTAGVWMIQMQYAFSDAVGTGVDPRTLAIGWTTNTNTNSVGLVSGINTAISIINVFNTPAISINTIARCDGTNVILPNGTSLTGTTIYPKLYYDVNGTTFNLGYTGSLVATRIA